MPDRDRDFAGSNAIAFSHVACQTIYDMAKMRFVPHTDSIRWSRSFPPDRITAMMHIVGLVTGICAISISERLLWFIAHAADPDAELPSDTLLASRPVHCDFVKEVINAAANQIIPGLEKLFGPFAALHPIIAWGEVQFQDLDGAFISCKGAYGAFECACLFDLGKLSIGTELKEAREKLGMVQDIHASLWIRPQQLPDARFSIVYRPLNEAGGDLYDVFQIDEHRYGYFVGDVAGHDIGTGFFSAAIKALLREHCVAPGVPPEQSMKALNEVLLGLLTKSEYVTACFAICDRKGGTVTVVNMGHPPMLIVSAHREPLVVRSNSSALCMFDQSVFRSETYPVEPGDRLLLYTDGLLETMTSVSWKRAMPALLEKMDVLMKTELERAATAIYDSHFSARVPSDDVLVMCVEI